MSTRYWVQSGGANAGNWDHTDNWSATQGGAGGATVPIDGDTVYIIGPATITSGLNQTGIDLVLLTITGTVNIGTLASPLIISATGGSRKVNYSGTGAVFLQAGTTAIQRLNVFSTYPGVLTLTGGTFVLIHAGTNGFVNCTGGTFQTGVITCGIGFAFASSCSIGATVQIAAGAISSAADIANVSQYAGAVTLTGAAGITDTIYVTNGVFNHNSSGTINDLTVASSGRARSSGASPVFIVTNSTKYAGAYMFDNDPVSVTYSNATERVGYP